MGAPNAEPQDNTIKEHIIRALRGDERLWSATEGADAELNRPRLLDLANKADERVIGLLLREPLLKDKFFVQIDDALVFKSDKFRVFMERNRVYNSYTDYKNRIGLTDGTHFLRDTNDVVLNFPYKDCILEGGQSTEEGQDTYYEYDEKKQESGMHAGGYTRKTTKRKEIFFNQVLAYDEIDRLHEPKAFVRWQRYTQHGTEKVQKLARDRHGTITENMIIKGNNYLALHSLKEQFAGKVKLIYIDPPYNTGNDGFKYNDNFNHSTWLVFMKNRLEVARQLLRDDGVMFVQCDDNEQAYLKVLMDEVFGRENFVGIIAAQTNPRGRSLDKYIAKTLEFVNLYAKNVQGNAIKKVLKTEDMLNEYSLTDERGQYREMRLMNGNRFFNRGNRPNLWYPIYANPKTNKVSLIQDADYSVEIYPINSSGSEQCWTWSRKKVEENKDLLVAKSVSKKSWKVYRKDYLEGSSKYTKSKSLWVDKSINHENGTEHVRKLNLDFTYPKSEQLLQKIIEMSTDFGDIVLDYHLGSGTTAAVAHKMGRQYIGIEQMDYIETVAVERLKKVIDGEQGGVSKAVGWQGGGNFIYCELAKWNEAAKEQIIACNSREELSAFFDEMCKRYFLDYNVKVNEFKDTIRKEAQFKALSLDQQKQIYAAMLDNNQLYIPRSEMADAKYAIRNDEQSLTREFYGEKEHVQNQTELYERRNQDET